MMYTIAILISDGFDEWAIKGAKPFFKTRQYQTTLISPKESEFVRSWSYKDWGPSYAVDKPLAAVDPTVYDALIMPGGALSVDNLRTIPDVLQFVQHFIQTEKTIGTLCHGIWPLVELDFVRGKRLTAVPTIKTDLMNAGAIWVDEPAVQHENLVSSRTSEDLDQFLALFHHCIEAKLQDTP